MFGTFANIIEIFPTTTLSCILHSSIITFGFSSLFSIVLFRIHRIHIIFNILPTNSNTISTNSSKLSDTYLMKKVLLYFLANALIFTIVTISLPIHIQAYSVSEDNFTACIICNTKSTNLLASLLIIFNGIFLLWGSYLSYKIKNIESNFNESTQLGISMYNASVTSIFTAALVFFLRTRVPSAASVLRVTTVLYISLFTIIVIYTPRLINIINYKNIFQIINRYINNIIKYIKSAILYKSTNTTNNNSQIVAKETIIREFVQSEELLQFQRRLEDERLAIQSSIISNDIISNDIISDKIILKAKDVQENIINSTNNTDITDIPSNEICSQCKTDSSLSDDISIKSTTIIDEKTIERTDDDATKYYHQNEIEEKAPYGTTYDTTIQYGTSYINPLVDTNTQTIDISQQQPPLRHFDIIDSVITTSESCMVSPKQEVETNLEQSIKPSLYSYMQTNKQFRAYSDNIETFDDTPVSTAYFDSAIDDVSSPSKAAFKDVFWQRWER